MPKDGAMPEAATTQAEVNILNKEYETYINDLKREWLANNRVDSRDVLEVMRPSDRAKVDQTIARWGDYITPLAEKWWKKRGFGVVWPKDSSEEIKVYKLVEPQ